MRTLDQTDMQLLRLLSENHEMHTVELAAALCLTVDEICSRMEYLQELGVVESTPVEQHELGPN